MRKWKRVAEVAAVFAAMSLAACGGGGADDPVASSAAVSGQVADGYLRGATVCLDVNGNKKCDDGEPSALTGAGGRFEITAAGIDPNAYPIVVNVPAEAIDEDTNAAVGKEYVLSAPAGRAEFVSPITTLVQSQIESNPGLSLREAEATVKGQIGVAEGVSLFDNYMERQDQGTAVELETMHKVAQVVARTMADMKAQMGTAAAGAGIDPDQNLDAILKLVVEEVMDRLGTIRTEIESRGDSFDPDDVKDAVTTGAWEVDTDTIAQRVEEKKTVVARGSYLNILDGDGIYWLDYEYYMDQMMFEYGNIKADGAGNPTEAQFVRSGTEWVADTEDEEIDEYVLTADGLWVPYSDGASNYAISPGSDGSILLTHKPTGMTEKIVAVEYDLSGKLHGPFLGELMPALVDSAATFPAGAKGYKLTFIPQQEIYSVETWMDQGVDQNYVWYGYERVAVNTLDGILQVFSPAAEIKRYLSTYGQLSVQFGDSGQLFLYKSWQPGQTAVPLERTGTWARVSVRGQEMIKMTIPELYRAMYDMDGMPFLVVRDGLVRRGEYLPAGMVDHDDEFNFNKIAFDSLSANINYNSTPTFLSRR